MHKTIVNGWFFTSNPKTRQAFIKQKTIRYPYVYSNPSPENPRKPE